MIESRMTSQGNGCIMCEIHYGIGMWKKSQWEGIKGKKKQKSKGSDEEPILIIQQCWYPEYISSKDRDITIQIQQARMLIK